MSINNDEYYKMKYLKYKNKLLSLIKKNKENEKNNKNEVNNLIDEKKKNKINTQIFKTINKISKIYEIKKSKYIVGVNTSLYLHNIIDNINNIDIISKDLNKKNKKQDIINKIYFNVNITNYNEVKDEKLNYFYKYLQKRSFKNKTFVMNKKSKLYVINFEELLIYKLFNYDMKENNEIIDIMRNISILKKYIKLNIVENIINILKDLDVPNKIIVIFKK